MAQQQDPTRQPIASAADYQRQLVELWQLVVQQDEEICRLSALLGLPVDECQEAPWARANSHA